VGCILHGCCLGRACDAAWFTVRDAAGVARWPAAQVELLFNVLALGVMLVLRWKKILPGQRFHLYLIAYGLFRFGHEFLRDTPSTLGPFTGYQMAALALTALGTVGFILRRRKGREPIAEEFSGPPAKAPAAAGR